jgi:hypothetical protein
MSVFVLRRHTRRLFRIYCAESPQPKERRTRPQGSSVAKLPTQPGDVLILRTKKSFTVYAVGSVSHAGQQDFHDRQEVLYFPGQDAALDAAKTLIAPGGRIYLLDLDTAEGSEMSNSPR